MEVFPMADKMFPPPKSKTDDNLFLVVQDNPGVFFLFSPPLMEGVGINPSPPFFPVKLLSISFL